MKGSVDRVIGFSDRPVRKAGRISADAFIKGWSKGTDSFRANNPEALLSAYVDGRHVSLVLQLSAPSYKPDAGSFSYDVKIVKSWRHVDILKSRFNRPSLFIDDWPEQGSPFYCTFHASC